MNASIHAKLSCKSAGTENQQDFDFFYKIHDFMDWSKEVEGSNRHRLLSHSLWFVKRVVIPVFGHTYLTVGSNKPVNMKDDMEQNHIIADFRGRFLPTLSDYFDLVEDNIEEDTERFRNFRCQNHDLMEAYPQLEELLLSPLYNTGYVKSLWLTHNSWFLGAILPLIPEYKAAARQIRDYSEFSPSILFDRMKYDGWLQNGADLPRSFKKIQEYREGKGDKTKHGTGVSLDKI